MCWYHSHVECNRLNQNLYRLASTTFAGKSEGCWWCCRRSSEAAVAVEAAAAKAAVTAVTVTRQEQE